MVSQNLILILPNMMSICYQSLVGFSVGTANPNRWSLILEE